MLHIVSGDGSGCLAPITLFISTVNTTRPAGGALSEAAEVQQAKNNPSELRHQLSLSLYHLVERCFH